MNNYWLLVVKAGSFIDPAFLLLFPNTLKKSRIPISIIVALSLELGSLKMGGA